MIGSGSTNGSRFAAWISGGVVILTLARSPRENRASEAKPACKRKSRRERGKLFGNDFSGLRIEDHSAGMFRALEILKVEHVFNGTGQFIKRPLADAFLLEPVIFDKTDNRSLVGERVIHKVCLGPG